MSEQLTDSEILDWIISELHTKIGTGDFHHAHCDVHINWHEDAREILGAWATGKGKRRDVYGRKNPNQIKLPIKGAK